jgi:hypothetical protein
MEGKYIFDETLTLWRGRMGFKQYIPLKVAMSKTKSFKLCASSTGYLWKFIIYSGITTDLTSSMVPTDSPKISWVVVKLVEPLFGRGHTLWMNNFHNSPDLSPKEQEVLGRSNCLLSFYYIVDKGCIENTVSNSSSIVSCVFVATGMHLMSQSLATAISSGSSILTFRRHITLLPP